MPVTCARCGAQNPDGNAFCQSCGTPLTAAAVAAASAARPPYPAPPGPPPVAYPSPPPAAYQSPYYSPVPGAVQPPVHRTPWTLIIAAIVALVLIMVAAGTAIALIGNRQANTGANTNNFTNQLPTPSPAGTPTPIGSPTPIETGSTASNDGLTMPLPSGWSVANKDSQSITIVNPDGDGSVTAASGASSPAANAAANKTEIDKYFASKYPDTKSCPNTSTTTGTLDGAPGIFWILCFTLTSGSQSFPASAALFAGANSDGSVYYLVMLVTSQQNLDTFLGQTKPILQGIVWKLR